MSDYAIARRPRLVMTTNGVHVIDLTHDGGRYALICAAHPRSTSREVATLMDAANYARAAGSGEWCRGCQAGDPPAPLTADELGAM